MASWFSEDKIKSTRDKYLEYAGKNKEELETLKRIYERHVNFERKTSIIKMLSEKTGKNVGKLIQKYVPSIFFVSMMLMVIYIIFIFLSFQFEWLNLIDHENWIIYPPVIIMVPLAVCGFILESLRNSPNEKELNIINDILSNKYVYGDKMITPENPFSNQIHLIETIESCERYINWIDKYFNEIGLRFLNKGIQPSVREIKIITSFKEAKKDLRDYFKKLKSELKNKGLSIELRVLCDKKLLGQVHNRYLFSAGACYDLPSPDTIKRSQLSSITKVDGKKINFEKYWNGSLDIIKDWKNITNQTTPKTIKNSNH